MNFSNFIKETSGLTITFYNSLPIQNINNILFFEDNSKGSFIKKEFRWSFNNIYWSSWEELNQGNITNINMNSNYYLYLEIRYVVTSLNSGRVNTFSVEYEKNN